MIVKEAAESQEFKFISRYTSASGSVTVIDEQKNSSASILIMSYGADRHYTTVTLDLSSYDNERNYMFIFNGTSGEMYRTKVFLTTQDASSYSINDGLYTQPAADNTYLVAT